MLNIEWIEYDEIFDLHQYTIDRHGGSKGLRSKDLLSSGLNRPRNYFFYKKIQDLYILASLYAEAVVCNHPFIDGNKRTGFLTANFFLCKNGIVKNFNNDRIFKMTLDLAEHSIEYVDYANFLKCG